MFDFSRRERVLGYSEAVSLMVSPQAIRFPAPPRRAQPSRHGLVRPIARPLVCRVWSPGSDPPSQNTIYASVTGSSLAAFSESSNVAHEQSPAGAVCAATVWLLKARSLAREG